MEEEELFQVGWRLPRNLIERVDRAYYQRKASGPLHLTKSEFVADLISGALHAAKSLQRRAEAARQPK
jgi:hypothetical protein